MHLYMQCANCITIRALLIIIDVRKCLRQLNNADLYRPTQHYGYATVNRQAGQ